MSEIDVTPEVLAEAKRRFALAKLLDEVDWLKQGFASKHEWLRATYGRDLTNLQLIDAYINDMDNPP